VIAQQARDPDVNDNMLLTVPKKGSKTQGSFRRLQTSAPFPGKALSDPFRGSEAFSGYRLLP
jgi:hypothetical protein